MASVRKRKPKRKEELSLAALIVPGGLRLIDLDRPLKTQEEIIAWYEANSEGSEAKELQS